MKGLSAFRCLIDMFWSDFHPDIKIHDLVFLSGNLDIQSVLNSFLMYATTRKLLHLFSHAASCPVHCDPSLSFPLILSLNNP